MTATNFHIQNEAHTTPVNWNVDLAHSSIGFSARHMMFAKVRGRFGKYEVKAQLDEADPTKSTIAATIDATSIDTGVADRDTHLRSADFFDAEKFPTLRFESRRVDPIDADRFKLVGDLTIRDVTREVALDVERTGRGKDPWGNQRTGFHATTSLDRKDFGLKWNQVLEAGGVLVSDRIDIEIELQVIATAAPSGG
jgi:polyisoprenoid-binding protein YceI